MTTLRACWILAPLSVFLVHCGDDGASADGEADDGSTSQIENPGGSGSGLAGSGAGGTGATGATGGAGNSGGSGAGPGDDLDPPTIVSVSPSDGSVGVTADTDLVIEFSEPMDKVATQASYQSADIPSGGVTFSWNAEGTILTIDPVADLAYATGPTPDAVAAASFSFTISQVAADEAGNALAEPATTTFDTLRRIEHALEPIPSLCGLVRSDTGLVGTSTWVGDTSGNGQYKGFATMDIAPLPENIVLFEEATLRLDQLSSGLGNPYAGLGGLVNVQHVLYPVKNLAALSVAPLSLAGVLSTNQVEEYKEVAVLAQVEEDYAEREARLNRSQYRLEFPVVTDFDETADVAIFHSATSELVVRYLIE